MTPRNGTSFSDTVPFTHQHMHQYETQKWIRVPSCNSKTTVSASMHLTCAGIALIPRYPKQAAPSKFAKVTANCPRFPCFHCSNGCGGTSRSSIAQDPLVVQPAAIHYLHLYFGTPSTNICYPQYPVLRCTIAAGSSWAQVTGMLLTSEP